MDLNYSSEETDRSSSSDELGTGRSYECIFCKRGFTTAQALGGHMNIHRKERVNKTKPSNFPAPSTTSNNNHSDLGFYSQIPSHLLGGTAPSYCHVQVYFPATACGVKPSHVLSVENQRDHLFAQDWRKRNFSLYTNPLCVDEIKDKFQDSEDHGLDLELRLGHHP